jgi:hypothetical protein
MSRKILLKLIAFVFPFIGMSQASIVSVSPNSVYQGDTVTFTVIGHNTHFTQGINDAKLANSSTIYYYYALSETVTNDTTVLVKIFFHYSLNPGLYDFYLTTVGNGSLFFNSAINLLAGSYPPSISITPNTAAQGQTVNVTVNGHNTRFLQSNLSTGGIDLFDRVHNYSVGPTSVVYINDSLINATFNFKYTDHPSVYDVDVNTYAPTPPITSSNGFTLTPGSSQPKINSISPGSSSQGSTVTVHVSCSNTHFTTNTNAVTIGGIAASPLTVIDDSTLDAGFTFSYNTTTSSNYVFKVANSTDGNLVAVNTFTVNTGLYPPSIKNIDIPYGRIGQTLTIHVAGKNTTFQQSLNTFFLVNSFGHTITPGPITYINDSLMFATFNFTGIDSTGIYKVEVPYSTLNPTLLLPNAFTLYPAGASIISISPVAANIGDTVVITVNSLNAHYLSGANTVQLLSKYGGAPITGTNVTPINDSTLTAKFTSTNSNFTGKYSVSVYNAVDNTVQIDTAFSLNFAPGNAHIVSASPPVAIFSYPVTITVHATGTHFQTGLDTIRLSNGVIDIYPGSMTVNNDTTITANFMIPMESTQLPNESYLDIVIWRNMPLVLVHAIETVWPVDVKSNENNSEISIYPNPAGTKLFVETNSPGISTLSLYDLSGKLVLNQNTANKGVLDVSALEEGIYVLTIKTSDAIKSKKIIIAR